MYSQCVNKIAKTQTCPFDIDPLDAAVKKLKLGAKITVETHVTLQIFGKVRAKATKEDSGHMDQDWRNVCQVAEW